MKRLTALIAGLTLALLTFGCGDTTTDNRTNTSNATVINNNANRNTSPQMNTNSEANANRGAYNANISQEDYDKEKDSFGKKKNGRPCACRIARRNEIRMLSALTG